VDGSTVTISVNVTDQVAPYVQEVRLFFRRAGVLSYSTRTLSLVSGSMYAVTLSGGDVAAPGLQYYITATDGQATTSDPSVDAGTVPHSIPVLPNVAPLITHTPIASATAGHAIGIEADVADVTNSVAEVKLLYRTTGTLLDQTAVMTLVSGDRYRATIAGSAVAAPGLTYRIRASDDLGITTQAGPYSVPVTTGPILSWTDPAGPLPACGVRARNEAVVGSIRDLRWSVSPSETPLRVSSTRLRVNTGRGNELEIPLATTRSLGGGGFSSQWISAGVYMVRLEAGGMVKIQRAVLLR